VCRRADHERLNPDLAAQYRAISGQRRRATPVQRTCVVCTSTFLGRPNATVCSTSCRHRRTYEIGLKTGSRAAFRRSPANRDAQRRRRAAKAAAPVTPVDELAVFERDGWGCQLCGEPVDPLLVYPDPMSKSLDHVVPLARGGGHSPENSQLAHLVCNLRKGARRVG